MGEGYGGYLTTRLLASCGAALAPVTVWQEHNPLLARRYLGQVSLETWRHYSEAGISDADWNFFTAQWEISIINISTQLKRRKKLSIYLLN